MIVGIILAAILLLILFALLAPTSVDHSEFDHPVAPLIKPATNISKEHDNVVKTLELFHKTQPLGISGRRRSLAALFKRPCDCAFIGVDVDGLNGEWALADGVDPNRRLLYIHGGSFMLGSAECHRYLSSQLSAVAGVAVLAVDYRMFPEHKVIHCHQDARKAYSWILENGPDGAGQCQDLFIAGDSAGGNICLSLLAFARDQGLKPANAAVCFAPLTDWSLSSPSLRKNIKTDPFLGPEIGKLARLPRSLVTLLLRYPLGTTVNNPEVSPLLGELSGLPDTLIQVSRDEMLFDDSQRYANKASLVGSKVDLQVWPKMVHVFQAFGPQLDEANEALVMAGKFIRSKFS